MLNLFNQTDLSINLQQLKKEINKILIFLLKEYNKLSKDVSTINILFLSHEGIQNLNRDFLHKNKPTDVLTFVDEAENSINGDIAICLEEIYQNMLYYKKDLAFLFYETVLHGFLHIFGLTHNYSSKSLSKVYKLQESILNKINLNNKIVYEFYKKFDK